MDKDYLGLSDFDYDIYRSHSDLKLLTNEQLADHYLQYGIDEGRFYNGISDRKAFIRMIEKKGKVLEIGPLDNPQLDHLSPDYSSIDVFNRAELIKNYINDEHVDKKKIVEPTYVITNNDYSGIRSRFNMIFSSHNIEHMPCLVVFLNNLDSILDEDGNIYFIIPDKRYCFDHFKQETDIFDVLQSYHEKDTRPRLADVLRMRTQNDHNDPVAHWEGRSGRNDYENALITNYAAIRDEFNTGAYMDSHVSYFTPHSFLKIITLLKELNLVNLKISKLYHTLKGSNEFYAILTKDK